MSYRDVETMEYAEAILLNSDCCRDCCRDGETNEKDDVRAPEHVEKRRGRRFSILTLSHGQWRAKSKH